MRKKGFTLVELLVVIAILAVLGTAAVLVLNPAELIKRGRDATRISDLASVNSALAYYLSEASSPQLWPSGCSSAAARCTVGTTENFTGIASCSTNATSSVDGTGWVAVNLNSLTDGSPIGSFPVDPINNATYYYSYGCKNDKQYEMDAKMESTKYSSGSDDVQSTDGGDQAAIYEVGNNLLCCS